ncbi:hypothetical protein B0F90DRAFT_1821966 [Multifurca ochricompacta]|uniref:Uncharacterized protein n=1 Tax=Multifurca ochricompacta TaxID=376703 RepID=A0AAD4LZ49_9AGAM|nr:hypothetical protein B0F90DRAFT_1821966 [Multifurca ochricompacta]
MLCLMLRAQALDVDAIWNGVWPSNPIPVLLIFAPKLQQQLVSQPEIKRPPCPLIPQPPSSRNAFASLAVEDPPHSDLLSASYTDAIMGFYDQMVAPEAANPSDDVLLCRSIRDAV